MGIWVAMGFMATVNLYQNSINTKPAFSIFITIESYASIRFEVTDVVQTSLLYTDAIITFPSTMPKEYLVKRPRDAKQCWQYYRLLHSRYWGTGRRRAGQRTSYSFSILSAHRNI